MCIRTYLRCAQRHLIIYYVEIKNNYHIFIVRLHVSLKSFFYLQKNIFTSPETETMATCLDCLHKEPKSEKKGPCFCKLTPNKIKRSTSLKESPPKHRKSSFSFSEKRSLSMSSLHRSRSVQKLDFSMDMSVDGSFHNHSQGKKHKSL